MLPELSLHHVTNLVWAFASLKWATPTLMPALVAGQCRAGRGWGLADRVQCACAPRCAPGCGGRLAYPRAPPALPHLCPPSAPLPRLLRLQRSSGGWWPPPSPSQCSTSPTCCGAWPSRGAATARCGTPPSRRCAAGRQRGMRGAPGADVVLGCWLPASAAACFFACSPLISRCCSWAHCTSCACTGPCIRLPPAAPLHPQHSLHCSWAHWSRLSCRQRRSCRCVLEAALAALAGRQLARPAARAEQSPA